jgi:hypothetical protein
MYYDDGGVYLVDELRDWFKWGGFPYCKFYLAGHKMLPWDARPNAEKIIPLLREGLLEV